MAKAAPPTDKYFLRSLHQEIDFYDRKLAYINNYEEYANPVDRDAAQGKLMQKRASLERTARELAAAGVEFAEADLPRSFRMPAGGADPVAQQS